MGISGLLMMAQAFAGSVLGYVDKWRIHRRIDVMSTKPRLASGGFVIAGGNAAGILELVEAPLDKIA